MICCGPEAGGNRLGAIWIKMKCPFLFLLHRAGDTKTASPYETHTVMVDIFTRLQIFAFRTHVLDTQRCVCTDGRLTDEVPQTRSLMKATKGDKLRWLNVWIYVEHMLKSGGSLYWPRQQHCLTDIFVIILKITNCFTLRSLRVTLIVCKGCLHPWKTKRLSCVL